jgi:hypothetical protein
VRLTRRPGLLAGAICGVITVSAVLVDELTTFAHEWMPHIAATAATIGLTVTIVEAILRREADERLRPRRERVLDEILRVFAPYLSTVASDYTRRQISAPAWTITDGIPAFLDLWLAEPSSEDDERRGPMLLTAAAKLAEGLKRYRDTDLDVLPANLVQAIDEFISTVGLAQSVWARSRSPCDDFSPTNPDEDRRFALAHPVRTAKSFAEALISVYPSAARKMAFDIACALIVTNPLVQRTRGGTSPRPPEASA